METGGLCVISTDLGTWQMFFVHMVLPQLAGGSNENARNAWIPAPLQRIDKLPSERTLFGQGMEPTPAAATTTMSKESSP
jgi:hypothetical protein